jgi:5-methylthioadenosine/S-adenosylhomocysteine deaminase
MPVIHTAEWVLPIAAPPIKGGAIAIDGASITAVGTHAEVISKFPAAPVEDAGEAAILPGFVNAHSHLELTVMRGFLEPEENDFFAWLRKLTVARMSMTNDDLLVSARCGALEAARAGVTCLGDSSSFASHVMQALTEVGLRGIVYQESFGPDPALADENTARLREQLAEMRMQESALVRAGVSPHAPYTVSRPQLELIARLANDEKLPLMMHAAESESERLFLTEGAGVFAEGLRKRNIEWHAPGISTIQYLKEAGILDTKPLLAHCVNVDEKDIATIATAGAGIAHCPKSNAKLGHGHAPFARLFKAGIKVGLGSDSVASNNTCDILEEARFATLMSRGQAAQHSRRRHADGSVTANDALFAATLGGARALGLDQIGALQAGMQADLAIVRLNGAHQQPASNPVDTVIFSSSASDVVRTIVAGKDVYRDGRSINIAVQELQIKISEIRNKLEQ